MGEGWGAPKGGDPKGGCPKGGSPLPPPLPPPIFAFFFFSLSLSMPIPEGWVQVIRGPRLTCTSETRTINHSDGRNVLASSSESMKRNVNFRSMHRIFLDTNLKFENKMKQHIGPKLRQRVTKTFFHAHSWILDKWLAMLTGASNTMRFDFFDTRGELEKIQCHSGVREILPKFFPLHEVRHEWKTHIYHTISPNNYRSIIQGRPIAGGTSGRAGEPPCFFSAMCPLDKSLPEASDVPASIQKTDVDAVNMFDWKVAQVRGLKFCHTGSIAIVQHNTIPTEPLVEVEKSNRNNSET